MSSSDVQGFLNYLSDNGLTMTNPPSGTETLGSSIRVSTTRQNMDRDQIQSIFSSAFKQYPNLNYKGTINVEHQGQQYTFSWPLTQTAGANV